MDKGNPVWGYYTRWALRYRYSIVTGPLRPDHRLYFVSLARRGKREAGRCQQRPAFLFLDPQTREAGAPAAL